MGLFDRLMGKSQPTGDQLADEGIARAESSADAAAAKGGQEAWTERAHRELEAFCACHRGQLFAIEDVRLWAEARGLPTPPEPRAWGGTARWGKHRKLIEPAGYAKSRVPNKHSCPVQQYRAL